MSWSGSVDIPKGTTDTAALIDGITIAGNDQALPERDAQVQIAKEAAKHLIGAVCPTGTPEDTPEIGFRVSMSGHANPGHKPTNGYANDCVNLSISQI